MIPPLTVVLDGWARPGSPASPASPVTWVEFCYRAFAATPPQHRNRWIMGHSSYLGIRAECALSYGVRVQDQDGLDTLLGIPVVVQDGGGLPHLE